MIPLFDLKRQYEGIRNEVEPAMNSVMDSGYFILGENVSKFEEEFARYNKTKLCIGVASGTDALMLALKAIGASDNEVITVANTASPTAVAIINAGAVPVLVDCNSHFNIDVSQIEKKITKRTKAILPVHLYGQPCDMDEIVEIAEKHSLEIVEDACQAHGAAYKGRKAGSFNLGCFSFYPTKNLGCYGDGGAIVTNDDSIAEKCRMLRFYGQKNAVYNSITEGYNSRLDELQAAILRVKLRYLDKWNEIRARNARIYNDLLESVVEIPEVKGGRNHVYYLYVIKAKNRDKLKNFLASKGIGTGIHYPFPIHRQPAFKGIKGAFPEAEKNAKEILSLPMFPELEEKEIREVCKTLAGFFRYSK